MPYPLALIFLFFTFNSFGQTLVLEQPLQTKLDLSPYLEVYIDKTANLSLEDIQKHWQKGDFIAPEAIQLASKFQRGRYRYWLEFSLQNIHPTDTLELFFAPRLNDTIHFYRLQNDMVQEKIMAGWDMPNMEVAPKWLIPSNSYIPLKIPPLDSSQYLVLTRNQMGVHGFTAYLYPLDEKPTAAFLPTLYYYLWTAMFLGILFFVSIYGFFQFALTRDKAFLYYALYVLCICFYQLRELWGGDLMLSYQTFLTDYEFHLPAIIGIYVFYILFIAEFLNSKSLFPLLHRLLKLMIILILAYGLMNQFLIRWDLYVGWAANFYFRLATTPFFIVLLVWMWRIKDQLVRIIAWGTSLLTATSIAMLIWSYLSPNYYLFENWGDVTHTGVQIGILLELLFFTLGLSYRTKLIADKNQVMEVSLERQAIKTEELKKLNQFKSKLYTNITHEFRTPLTVIDGMAEQIRGNEESKSLILHNSHRLLNLINQMLDLSKIESNKLGIHWIQGNIIHFLSYLINSLKSFAHQQKIMLSFHSHTETLIMDYDVQKLERILINLLHNAIKFTPEYGDIKVSTQQIEQKGTAFLAITIKDTGKGIAAAELPHIFDRFYQIDNSTIRENEGTGIGLALAKELTQLLEGQISVSSTIAKGTSFQVLFPIKNTAPLENNLQKLHILPKLATPKSSLPNSLTSNQNLPMLLIVEDNQDVLYYLQSFLYKDYQLLMATNGQEGIDIAIEQIPDIIISDIMMPKKDGFELCETLKQDQRTSHIPLILLTAKATLEDRISGLSVGADAYLAKPFSKEELLVRLKKLIEGRQILQQYYRDENVMAKLAQLSPQQVKEQAFLRQIHQIVHENLENLTFTIPQLCLEVTMSKTQLYRKIKALTGKSVAIYIRSIRLKEARHLLQTTDLPVNSIAEKVGFSDVSYFARVFKKEFGFSPSERK